MRKGLGFSLASTGLVLLPALAWADPPGDGTHDACAVFAGAESVSVDTAHNGQVGACGGTPACQANCDTADFYKFAVTAGQDISIDGGIPQCYPASNTITFRLWDPDGFQRDANDFPGAVCSPLTRTLFFDSAMAGDWRVSFSGGTTYTFRITVTDPAPPPGGGGGGGGGNIGAALALPLLVAGLLRLRRPHHFIS